MAKAQKLPSGSWRIQVYSHTKTVKQADGSIKKIKVKQSFTSNDTTKAGKYEVEAMAADFIRDRDRKARYDYSLGEGIDVYLESKKDILSPSTLRSYKSLRKNAYEDLEGIKLKKLTRLDVQRWVNSYSSSHAPKTVKNAYGLLVSTVEMLEPDLRLNPTLPAVVKPEYYTPTDDEIKKLIEAVKGTKLESAVLLSAFGALRRSELCALTAFDVDRENNTIRINKGMVQAGKGLGYVVKPMPKTTTSIRTIQYSKEVIDRLPTEGRLVNYTPSKLTNAFQKKREELGLPYFRLHDLRSYTASISHALGIPDQYIEKMGGWTDKSTVMKNVYRRTMKDKEAQYSEQLTEHFDSLMS